MQTEFDVVIIGSGAGGAPIAHTLALAGKSVLILEKGALYKAQYQDSRGLSDWKRDEMFATGAEKRIEIEGVANRGAAYFSSHVEPDLNDEPHVYREKDGKDYATIEGYTAHVVGGGTQLYGGVSLRFSPLDFGLGSFNAGRNDIPSDVRSEACDWAITYDELEKYYDKTEELIGINGTIVNQSKPFRNGNFYQTPLPPNPISNFIEIGMDALGMPRYRTPLAVITEDHAPSKRQIVGDPKTALVNRYGDPLGLKSNTWVSLLYPISDLPNFELRPNCVVTHLECDGGGRVNKVNYLDPAGTPRSVKGKIVVVACSAIESVRLLMISAEEQAEFRTRVYQNDLLGKYFLTHCFGGAEAIMPGRYDKSVSLDSDWATDFCATEDFIRANKLWAGGAVYNNTSDQALPISLARTHGSQDLDNIWKSFVDDPSLIGENLVKFLDENFGTRLSVSFMANQVPVKENRIELHPTIKDKWNRRAAYIIKKWHSHDEFLMTTLAKQCEEILRRGGAVKDLSSGGVHQAPNAYARIANHILGGARFGTKRADSVLDTECRVWDFENLFVTDGSFMPTSGGGNPTLTIQANAFRVADRLAAII